MVLLNGCANNARHPNAIAAHFHEAGLARLIEHGRPHGLGVLRAQVEDMAHLDAPLNREATLAIGRGITGQHISDVGHQRGLWQVAAPVHTPSVGIGLVCAHHEIGHLGHGAIGHHLH